MFYIFYKYQWFLFKFETRQIKLEQSAHQNPTFCHTIQMWKRESIRSSQKATSIHVEILLYSAKLLRKASPISIQPEINRKVHVRPCFDEIGGQCISISRFPICNLTLKKHKGPTRTYIYIYPFMLLLKFWTSWDRRFEQSGHLKALPTNTI